MKMSLLFVFCGITLCAMDGEEKPHPEHKLQLIIRNKNTTTEEFKTHLETYPNLVELENTGHQITLIPYVGITLNGLDTLDLSNGALDKHNTLPAILVMAPKLHTCKLAGNQIPALSENETHADLPTHCALTSLDCSNNQITKVDFTELREKLPNLTYLNLSNGPLDTFKTKDFKATPIITTVDLRNTVLPDSEKKEIVKNAQQTCVIDRSDECERGYASIMIPLSALAYAGPFFPLILKSTSSGGLLAAIFTQALGGTVLGGGSTYLGFLGFKSPKNRFKTAYIPLMDNATFPEEEVTTRYARFVKGFPYFCKCCRAEDPEYVPLTQVEQA